LAVRYAQALMTDGIVRGLLGPREAARVWDRHLLNSAVLAELIPDGSRVVDVGSGAGLPGIPLALVRPECRVVLLEPLARRCVFLDETVSRLGLGERVTVLRGRAPDVANVGGLPFFADYAVARAVAPLERLVSWTMPLVRSDGQLLAMRGERVEQELQEAGPGITRHGGGPPMVIELGEHLLGTPVRVVRVLRRQQLGQQGQRKGESRARGHWTNRSG
jgi:16S rRNA (guanine527-N7)-methyltransferase